MTQHEKIIEMCLDEQWHCQNEFRSLYIFSPHKRRSEIELKGKYKFINKKCEHNIKGQFDYKMIPIIFNKKSDFIKKEIQPKLC